MNVLSKRTNSIAFRMNIIIEMSVAVMYIPNSVILGIFEKLVFILFCNSKILLISNKNKKI